MPTIKKTLLNEKAYQHIKYRIISLEFCPGTQLDEATLEKSLSIGRTPIREALFRLAAEGLLEVVQNRGFFVKAITIEDVKSLFEAMMILERAAVVLAVKRVRKDHIERLQRVHGDLKEAMKQRDFLQITLLNSNFHRIIYEATDNAFLRSSLRPSSESGPEACLPIVQQGNDSARSGAAFQKSHGRS